MEYDKKFVACDLKSCRRPMKLNNAISFLLVLLLQCRHSYAQMCISNLTVTNGQISYGGFDPGDVANLTCDSGYESLGTAWTTCQSNMSWSPDLGTCEKEQNYCSDPTPENGVADTTNGFQVDSLALITCDSGYTVTGSRVLICQIGRTWSNNSTCSPLDCGNLTISQGEFDAENGTEYLQTATVTCETGYIRSGDETLICQISGQWSYIPTCDPSDCKNPTPSNGAAEFTVTTFGGRANISCNEGYIIEGDDQITCQADATWSDTTICSAIDCGYVSMSNGKVTYAVSTTFGSSAFISCDSGYTVEGTAFIICFSNGSWSDTPSCEPVDCGDPTPANGSVNNTSTTFGTNAAVACNLGYNISGSSSITCTDTGIWSDTPVCIAIDCGEPSPEHGEAEALEGTSYPNSAAITCSYGYNLVGSSSINCLSNGVWSDTPVCVLKELGDNCTTTSDCTVFDDHSVCDTGNTNSCVCDVGYRNDTNVCTVLDCGNPSVLFGSAAVPGGTVYGQYAFVVCNDGYELNGTPSLVCLETGLWSTSPTCEPVDCNAPAVTNALVSISGGTTYTAKGTITCSSGYTLSGGTTITCQADGTWSTGPSCSPLDCKDPGIAHGFAIGDTTYPEGVVVLCTNGYELNGDDVITCLPTGSWSSAPTCIPVDCGPLSDPGNGNVDQSSGTTYGKSALYTCDKGYSVSGDTTRICLSGGAWSGANSTCTQDENYVSANMGLILALVSGLLGLVDLVIIVVIVYYRCYRQKNKEAASEGNIVDEEDRHVSQKQRGNYFPYDSPRDVMPPVFYSHPPPGVARAPIRTQQYSPRDDIMNPARTQARTPKSVAKGKIKTVQTKALILPAAKEYGNCCQKEKGYSLNYKSQAKDLDDLRLQLEKTLSPRPSVNRSEITASMAKAETEVRNSFTGLESVNQKRARDSENRQFSESRSLVEDYKRKHVVSAGGNVEGAFRHSGKREEGSSNKSEKENSQQVSSKSHSGNKDLFKAASSVDEYDNAIFMTTRDEAKIKKNRLLNTTQIDIKLEANISNPPSVQVYRPRITRHGLGSTENLYEDSRSRASSISPTRSRSDSISSVLQTTSKLPSVEVVKRHFTPISPARSFPSENQLDLIDDNHDGGENYDHHLPKENRSSLNLARSPEIAYLKEENSVLERPTKSDPDISPITAPLSSQRRAEYVSSSSYSETNTPNTCGGTNTPNTRGGTNTPNTRGDTLRAEYVSLSPYNETNTSNKSGGTPCAEYVSSSHYSETNTPNSSGDTLRRKRKYRQHVGETDSDKELKSNKQDRRRVFIKGEFG